MNDIIVIENNIKFILGVHKVVTKNVIANRKIKSKKGCCARINIFFKRKF